MKEFRKRHESKVQDLTNCEHSFSCVLLLDGAHTEQSRRADCTAAFSLSCTLGSVIAAVEVACRELEHCSLVWVIIASSADAVNRV